MICLGTDPRKWESCQHVVVSVQLLRCNRSPRRNQSALAPANAKTRTGPRAVTNDSISASHEPAWVSQPNLDQVSHRSIVLGQKGLRDDLDKILCSLCSTLLWRVNAVFCFIKFCFQRHVTIVIAIVRLTLYVNLVPMPYQFTSL